MAPNIIIGLLLLILRHEVFKFLQLGLAFLLARALLWSLLSFFMLAMVEKLVL